jgi:hypothetical protein
MTELSVYKVLSSNITLLFSLVFIESDPARRPHELLLTDWKQLDVPLSTTYDEHPSFSNPPCVYPSLNEHEQVSFKCLKGIGISPHAY